MSAAPDLSGADVAFSYAPAKIIIGGEHAVVYGHPAVAGALDRGIRIATRCNRLLPGQTGPLMRASGLGFVGQVRADPHGEGPDVLRKALVRLRELCGDRVGAMEFIVDSSIAGGRGLGSSAALSVAMIRGVYRYFNEQIDDAQVKEFAMELEGM